MTFRIISDTANLSASVNILENAAYFALHGTTEQTAV